MALFSRQSQVDIRVKEIFSKTKSEEERQLKCLTIAQLYYQVGANDKARQYIQLYLRQKPSSLPAHKLLAQSLTAQQMTAEALHAWDKCYQLLTSSGTDRSGGQLEEEVVTAGCRLALKVPATSTHVTEWLARARLHVPRDPLVQQLHEHSLQLSAAAGDVKQLEKILTAGVAARPLDVASHCRLAELVSRDQRHSEAFHYVCGVHRRRVFDCEEQWLNTMAGVCQRYSSSKTEVSADVLLVHLSAVDQLLELQLVSGSDRSRSLQLLHRLDQLVGRLSGVQLPKGVSHLTQAEHNWLVQYNIGQLCFRAASLLLSSDKSASDDIVDMARAMLKIASEKRPLDSRSAIYQHSTRKDDLEFYRTRAVCRVLESRQCLLSHDTVVPAASRHSVTFDTTTDMNLLYNRLFGGKQSGEPVDVPEALSASCQASSGLLTVPLTSHDTASSSNFTLNPTDNLQLFVVEYLSVHRASLPRIVWLMRHFRLGNHHQQQQPLSGYVSSYMLWRQLTPQNVPSVAVSNQRLIESLTKLDMLCFLQATLCVSEMETPVLSSLEAVKPFSVSRPFCTQQQQQWWDSVNQLYSDSCRPRQFAELRQCMSHGLAVIQCNSVDSAGLSAPHVLLALADWCQQQAGECKEERESLLSRMETYLSAALTILSRRVNSTRVATTSISTKNALFVIPERCEPTADQLTVLLDSCSCRLAARCRETGQLTRSLGYVTSLGSADAAYQRALTLLSMSEEAVGQASREKLRQAKEAFYLTLDRLRGGSMCHDRPLLDRELAGQITAVEDKLLDDIRDATRHVNGDDSSIAVLPMSGTPLLSRAAVVPSSVDRCRLPAACTSTPLRSQQAAGNGNNNSLIHSQTRSMLDESLGLHGMEVRPSPERISAELRNLDRTQQTILQLLLDRSTAGPTTTTPAPAAAVTQTAVPEAVTDQLNQLSIREREIKQKLDSLTNTVDSLQKELSDLRLEVRAVSSLDSASAAAAAAVPQQLPNPDLYNYMAWINQYQAAMRGFPAAQYGFGAAALPFTPQTAAFQPSLAAAAAGYQPFQQLPEGNPGMMGIGAGFSLDSMPPTQLPTATVASHQPSSATSIKQEVNVPGNVTISVGDKLPTVSQGSLQVTQPPSVIVPAEHRKPAAVLSDLLKESPSSPVVSVSLTPSSLFKPPSASASAASGNQLTTTSANSPVLTSSHQPAHSFQISVPAPTGTSHADKLAEFMSVKPAFSSANLSGIPDRTVDTSLVTSPITKQSPARDRLNSSGSFHEEADYEPMPHFQPVVQLPLLNQLFTGEEGHECLFAGACKLLRFVSGEWKERGVGELRVMKRVEDGRCRIVMRRSQTHKVCANHYIAPSMKLSLMKNRTRDFVWAAKDFADEVAKDETLCARFKTDELANAFRTAFHSAQSLSSSSTSNSASGAAGGSAVDPSTPARVPTTVNTLAQSLAAVREREEDEPDDEEEYIDEEEEEEEESEDEEEDEEPIKAVACKPKFSFLSNQSEASKNSVFNFSADKNVAASANSGSGFQFGAKAPPSSEVSFSFGLPPKSKSNPVPTASVFSTSTTAGLATPSTSAPTVFGGFTFTTKATVISVASDTVQSTPTVPKPSATSATTTKSSTAGLFSGFSFGSGTPAATPAAVSAGSGGGGVFGSGSNTAGMDFASLAQSGNAFRVDPSFKGFSGAGRPLFASSSSADKNTSGTGDGEGETEEHYEPNVQFKPVIDLPDLVELKTGEESEEVLFCHRAKLYRMDDQLKEWKERGLGDIKILRDPGTHKCRVLMRRDQVLKLCANHIIGPGMKLSRLASSETAWVWSALDYSDGEENREKLAVKFKTVLVADKFRSVFDSCADPSQTPATPITSAKPDANPAPVMSAKSTATPTSVTSSKSAATPAAVTSLKSATSSVSTVVTSAPVAFTFGASFPSTNGLPAASSTATSVFGSMIPAGITPSSSSTPGTGGSGVFHFGGVKPLSPVKSRSRTASVNADPSVTAAGDEGGNEYYKGDEGEHLVFQPVIALPDEVEVRTGEESERVLYSHRCKLYRFASDTGEWKERGVGDVKLLLGDEQGRVRVLMRREPVMKLCLNQWLTDEQRFAFKDPRTVTWGGMDCSDGDPNRELFAARFKTAEIANDFVEHLSDAQKRLTSGEGFKTADSKSTATAAKSTSDKPKTAQSLEKDVAGTTDDVVVVGEVQASPAEQAAAEQLQLPSGFYLYKQLPDCPGCRGCRDQMPGELDSVTSTATAFNSATSLASSVTTPVSSTSSSAGFTFSFAPNSTSSSQTSTTSSSAGFVFGTALNGKSSLFGNTTASTAATKSVFGGSVSPTQSPKSLFGGSSAPQPTKSVFGGVSSPPCTSSSALFGGGGGTAQPKSVFGESPSSKSVFGGVSTSTPCATSGTSSLPTTASAFKSVFSASPSVEGTSQPLSLFGQQSPSTASPSTSATPSGASSGFVFGSAPSVFRVGSKPSTVTTSTTSSAPTTASGAGFVFGSGAAFTSSPSSSATIAASSSPAVSTGGMFSSAGGSLDFASLAKQASSSSGFNKAADFKFSGEGSAVFGSRAKSTGSVSTTTDATADGDDDPAEGHDPQFEPVVPLPDLVDVVTGEEDDRTVFCNRAVLYRFVDSQWKERGRGEMKILYNSNTRTHRVLLRRDQVHKLACHHRITESLVLKPLGTSTNAWIWSSVDHAEEEAKPELFAVKFKTQALAEEFRDVFETAVKAAASSLPPGGVSGHLANGDCHQSHDQDANDGEEDSEEDEEYVDDEDNGVRFSRDVTLYRVVPGGTQELGYGVLVIYDDNLMRVTVTDEQEEILCDHYIAANSSYEVDACCVEWIVNDDRVHQSSEPSKFRVYLHSEQEANCMANALHEGLELAQANE